MIPFFEIEVRHYFLKSKVVWYCSEENGKEIGILAKDKEIRELLEREGGREREREREKYAMPNKGKLFSNQ